MASKSRKLTSGTQIEVFEYIVNAIHRVTSLPVSIWVPEKDGKGLTIAASVGLPESYIKTAYIDLKTPSVTGNAFLTRKIQKVMDISSDPRWKYKEQAREMNWTSAICVPIKADEVVIGVISVYAFTKRSIPELINILPDFAGQISSTLEVGRQKAVLQQILDIDAKLQSVTESPKNVLNAIVKAACDLTGASCAVAYPFDIEHGEFYDIENVAFYGLLKDLQLTEKPRSKDGMASFVKRKGEIVLTDIRKQDPEMLKTSSFIKREKIRAFMGIALKVANNSLGILYVNFRTPHVFSKKERNTIRVFSHQASIALHNARLYQQAASQISALERLHEVGSSLTSVRNAPEELRNILTRIAQSAQDVLGADLVDLYQYFQTQDRYDLPPVQVGKRYDETIPKITIHKDDVIYKIVKKGGAEYILESQKSKTLITPFTVKRADSPKKRFVFREDIKSTAAIPLIVGAEIVGVLFANYRKSQSFSSEQRKLIELFAHQAAIAIWNARLFTNVQKRLEERLTDISAFQQIYEKMYSAKQGELMSLIAAKATELTNAKYGVLWLVDKDGKQLTCAGIAGDTRTESSLPKLPLDRKSINGWVMSTGKPYLSNNVKQDSHYRSWYKDARSELAVPLLYNNNTLGTLDVESTAINNFTEDHLELLRTLATQAAVAIQNSRIVKKLDTLDDVGRALTNTIRLQEQKILDLIYKEASALMDTNNMYIALYDEYTDIVRFGLAFVNGKRINLERNKRWQPRKAGQGKTEEIIHTKKPILHTSKAEAKKWYAQPGRKEYIGDPLASWIGVPMVIGNKVIGVIATYHPTREHLYNRDDLDILQSMATQAAIALDNARMFYKTNERLQALVEIEKKITSVIHLGEQEILNLIYKEASGLMDTNNMYIALHDEYTDIVHFGLAYANGKKINIEAELVWQPRKAGQGKTEEIIRTKQSIFHATKAEAEKWYAQPGRKEYIGDPLPSWIGVPMIVGDKAIGVIATYHPKREYVYSGEDLAILQSMANQAAAALESARSFEYAQKRIKDQETINIIAEAISAKVGTNELLQTIVAQIQEHLNCTHCAIFFPEQVEGEIFLVSQYTHGEFAERIKSRRFRPGEGLAGWVFEHGETAIAPDTLQDERYVPVRLGGYQSRSLMVVPVRMNGKTIGVISADHKELNRFDEDNKRLVETLAEHVSIALEKGRAYEEIAKLYEEAHGEAIAAKQLATLGTAIAALQHRINNTLNIIIPNITRLRRRIDVKDPTIREILDIIERNTRYTSDILMRIQAPLQEVESSNISVNAILNEISETAKKEWHKTRVRAKVKIKLDLDDSIPLIHLPVGQISEIVRNLIDNAYRAMKKGGTLTIASKMEQNAICIRVKDTAKGGISPAIQQRLFQKPVPSKEPGQGAGLGLWLSRLMLQGIGGNVTIDETGSTGTTMLIEIPVTQSGKEATHEGSHLNY